MFAKMIISLMMIGLLIGCTPAEEEAPEEDNQPAEEQIEEDMNDMGDMDEDTGDMNESETDPGIDDTDQPGDTEEPVIPEDEEKE